MAIPRPPGFPGFSALGSWVVKTLKSKLRRADPQPQAALAATRPGVRSLATDALGHTVRPPYLRPIRLQPAQAKSYHQFHIPRFTQPLPKFPRNTFAPTSYFLRPQVGAFPRRAWGPGSSAAHFHSSPVSAAVAVNRIAHSVSTALRSGTHPNTRPAISATAQIAVLVAARAACQITDGPAGYIRFTLSPPGWTPTDTDLSDPDIFKAIDTHITELQRVKKALLKLKRYGDFPVRATLPDVEAKIDVLFRGATADDVERWNANEFKLTTGCVGGDQVFCAGRFEEYVNWSEILDAERKADREMAKNKNEGLLKFWEELNTLEGRIH